MKTQTFKESQKEWMIEWRKIHLSQIQEFGKQNGKYYPHIIPREKDHIKHVLCKLCDKLPVYLEENPDIQAHTGTHNLLSSWITAANLYFPIRVNDSLQKLMLKFLQKHVSTEIIEITDVELEFAFPLGNKLNPEALLGELGGSRGSGQTSPDVAFLVKTKTGKGIILTECKYTEHSFYGCSARKIDETKDRINNPDPKRCLKPSNACDYSSICHQKVWKRKYLSLITFSESAKNKLKYCPAATAGYQLLRQQALAEGIAQSGEFDLVASTVAFDGRNADLIGCLRTTGIHDFQNDWAGLFDGKALFKTWKHQEWVQFVRDNQMNGEFADWVEYMDERYGY